MSLLVFNFTCWVLIFSMLSLLFYHWFWKEMTLKLEQDNDLDRKVNISVLLAWYFHFQCTPTPNHVFHSHKDVFMNMPSSLIRSFPLFRAENMAYYFSLLFLLYLLPQFTIPGCKSSHFLLNLLFCIELLPGNYVIYAHIFNLSVSSLKLLENAECSKVTSIFLTNSTSLPCTGMLNNVRWMKDAKILQCWSCFCGPFLLFLLFCGLLFDHLLFISIY